MPFTWSYLATVAGGALATGLITDILRQSLSLDPRWSGLVVAFLIQLGAWFFVFDRSPEMFGLAIINTFVVYAAANTGQAVLASSNRKPALVLPGDDHRFFDPWW